MTDMRWRHGHGWVDRCKSSPRGLKDPRAHPVSRDPEGGCAGLRAPLSHVPRHATPSEHPHGTPAWVLMATLCAAVPLFVAVHIHFASTSQRWCAATRPGSGTGTTIGHLILTQARQLHASAAWVAGLPDHSGPGAPRGSCDH